MGDLCPSCSMGDVSLFLPLFFFLQWKYSTCEILNRYTYQLFKIISYMPSEILHWCLESSLRWGAFPDYPGSPPGPLLIAFHLKAPVGRTALPNPAEEAVGKHHCLHQERKGVLGKFSDFYCEIPSYSGPVGGEDWPFYLFCLPAASLMNRFPSVSVPWLCSPRATVPRPAGEQD